MPDAIEVGDLHALFIEDDPDAHVRVRRALAGERPRITLECAERLAAGMELLEGGRFDVLLLDLSLPDSETDQTFERMQRLVTRLPVVVLTASADPAGGVAAVREGAQDYLVKGPETLKGLLARSLRYAVARWRADAALRESEQRYRDLTEGAPDAIFRYRIDEGGAARLEYVNRAFEAALGYGRTELRADPELGFALVHPEDRAMAQGLASGGAPERWTIRWLTRDGRVKWLDCRATALRQQGRLLGVQCVGRDVTAQVEAERELERTREQLAQSQKMEAVGRLAGGIAHDFNNLLTIISSYGYFANQALPEGDPVREDIRQILEAGRRAESLTSQLLAFSRRRAIAPKPVNLNQAVSAMDRMLRRALGEDIVLSTRLAPDLWTAYVDEHAFQQVLLNLAINARDAMPNGGKLTLETENVWLDADYARSRGSDLPPGEYVKTAVSDNGEGMDETTRSRIFEPFFTTKPTGKGTGLGLSTCYGLIRQAKGHIGVYSEPGKGTTFSVYLPRIDRPAQRPQPQPSLRSAVGSERILLVEDDVALREPAARALRQRGYDVVVADDAEHALRLAEASDPPVALLLTDVVMPGTSGKELADGLTHRLPGLKVLYMSGYTRDAIVHHGVLEEGIHLLNKPFSPEDLARKVRQVLDASDR